MSRSYLPALDGLRAVAVALVLGSHVAPRVMPGGGFGVDVFFVLSGFLITGILHREYGATRSIALRQFYWFRSVRIVPPVLFVLLTLYVFAPLIPIGRPWLANDAWIVLGSVADYTRVRGLGPDYLSNAWSLSVEEQFYFLWPIAFLILRTHVRHRWQMLAIIAGAALVVACWRAERYVEYASTPVPDIRVLRGIYDGFDTRADALLVGCLLALASSELRDRLGRFWPAALAILGAHAFGLCGSERWTYIGGHVVVALASAALVAALASARPAVVTRVLAVPPLRFVGRLSYSLYLWHFPILIVFQLKGRTSALDMAASLALAFALSMVTYVAVEKPCRRLRGACHRLVRYAAAGAMPTLQAGGVLTLLFAI